MPFNPQKHKNKYQKNNRQLRRPAEVSLSQPGCVNAKRQGADAKKANRRDVVQAFHQSKADANHDGGPCLRKGHGKKAPHGDLPSVRATSSWLVGWRRKLACAVMKT